MYICKDLTYQEDQKTTQKSNYQEAQKTLVRSQLINLYSPHKHKYQTFFILFPITLTCYCMYTPSENTMFNNKYLINHNIQHINFQIISITFKLESPKIEQRILFLPRGILKLPYNYKMQEIIYSMLIANQIKRVLYQ